MKTSTIIGAVALLVWGVIMVYFYQSGRVGEYLAAKGIFQPLLLVGGLGLTLVSIFNILHSGKDQGCGHDHDHGDDDSDHVHSHETTSSVLISTLILAIPVSAAALLTPDQYSASYVNKNEGLTDGRQKRSALVERLGSGGNTGDKQTAATPDAGGTPPDPNGTAVDEPDEWEFTIEDLENSLDRNEAGEFVIGVDDLFYTAGDEEIQRVLNGQPVETIGQLLPETVNNESGRRIRILKMTMTCCAADMRPMSLPVEFTETPPEFIELNWYKIHGKVRFEPAPAGYGQDDYDVPFIEALKITPTEEPENPYGY